MYAIILANQSTGIILMIIDNNYNTTQKNRENITKERYINNKNIYKIHDFFNCFVCFPYCLLPAVVPRERSVAVKRICCLFFFNSFLCLFFVFFFK